MRWWSQLPSLLGLLAGLALLLGPQTARAQQKEKQVNIMTADGVELAGTWYPGNKGDATVMLLHPIGKGEDSSKAGWDRLAKALNAKGYSVLRFDFRGHGASTTIQNPQKFYSFPLNRLVKANKAAPGNISVEDYGPAYYPVLVNDIAAAKSYLDRKNDNGECNTSALVVVGADTGATLGAIWLNSEWFRYKALAPNQQKPYIHLDDEPEGKGTVAAVFLSINPQLGKGVSVYLQNVLRAPGQVNAVPMLFVYGDEDTKGKAEAVKLEKYIKTNKFKNQAATGSYPIKGAGKARGRELLQKSLPTEADIVKYLEEGVLAKTPEWTKRDFTKSPYYWGLPARFPPGAVPRTAIEAKGLNENVIRWSTYAQFMR
jgi:pimeloyl-ACP methyl ester carboxylesterase